MKVSTVHMQKIAAVIEPLDTPERRTRYSLRDFPRSGTVNDLNKRYRWDLFYEARAYTLFPDDAGYLNTHLDTALKHIVPVIVEVNYCVCEEPSYDFRNVCRKCFRRLRIED